MITSTKTQVSEVSRILYHGLRVSDLLTGSADQVIEKLHVYYDFIAQRGLFV